MVSAHCPGEGVNVYVAVFNGLIVGDHVPEMPLIEVEGSEKLPL